MDLKIFFIGPKSYLWHTFVVWYLCKWKYIKGVIAVEIWRRRVIFPFTTYNYWKTKTKFENLNSPSCSVHPSGLRLVNNWNRFVLLLASVIGRCSQVTVKEVTAEYLTLTNWPWWHSLRFIKCWEHLAVSIQTLRWLMNQLFNNSLSTLCS